MTLTSDDSIQADSRAEYSFAITLLDGCLLDELYDPSFIDDIDYYIASTGLKIVNAPTFT